MVNQLNPPYLCKRLKAFDMAHHHHHHDHAAGLQTAEQKRVLILGILLNTIYVIIEAVAGFLLGSRHTVSSQLFFNMEVMS